MTDIPLLRNTCAIEIPAYCEWPALTVRCSRDTALFLHQIIRYSPWAHLILRPEFTLHLLIDKEVLRELSDSQIDLQCLRGLVCYDKRIVETPLVAYTVSFRLLLQPFPEWNCSSNGVLLLCARSSTMITSDHLATPHNKTEGQFSSATYICFIRLTPASVTTPPAVLYKPLSQ